MKNSPFPALSMKKLLQINDLANSFPSGIGHFPNKINDLAPSWKWVFHFRKRFRNYRLKSMTWLNRFRKRFQKSLIKSMTYDPWKCLYILRIYRGEVSKNIPPIGTSYFKGAIADA